MSSVSHLFIGGRVGKISTFIVISLFVLLLLAVLLSPLPRFNKPCSTVVVASDGQLLGARISADGQWRFPQNDTVPEKFRQCLIQFEDQYFRFHPGINFFAIGRAILQNAKAHRVVSGGSTITMQVARMAGNGKDRTIGNKLVEMLSALKLELRYSKRKILAIYASNAPFGGNLVGIEAACWRYFGHSARQLSWAEAATLAVLPNAPSLIFPGNNDQKLKIKRDRLLKKLLDKQIIEPLDYELAIRRSASGETVPVARPFVSPDRAPEKIESGRTRHHQHRLSVAAAGAGFGGRTQQSVGGTAHLQCSGHCGRCDATTR